LAVLALSVDRRAGRVQDRAAKSCFINDMVKKHLPVTKLPDVNKARLSFIRRSLDADSRMSPTMVGKGAALRPTMIE